jgi:hypothetical protein
LDRAALDPFRFRARFRFRTLDGADRVHRFGFLPGTWVRLQALRGRASCLGETRWTSEWSSW